MNYDLLYTMLNTESVSGGEIPLQKKVAAYMREAGFNVDTDKTGNVIAHINEESPVRVLMSGHIDEIGFRVTYISKPLLLPTGQGGRVRVPVLVKAKFLQQVSGTVFAFFCQFGIQQQLLRHACRKKLR